MYFWKPSLEKTVVQPELTLCPANTEIKAVFLPLATRSIRQL